MVHYYITVVEAEKIKKIVEELQERISVCSDDLCKTRNELESMKMQVKNLELKEKGLNLTLKNLNLEFDKKRAIMLNMELIEKISVDEKSDEVVWNGLVSLNRDILMKLLKIIKDEKKIRNVFV
jgi:hypothetical protein